MDSRENQRLALQAEKDAEKTQLERNKLGQFATPTKLANDVITQALSLLNTAEGVRFFDPAIGTGSFFSALQDNIGDREINWARGVEIDPHYGVSAQRLWEGSQLSVQLADFTKIAPPMEEADKVNFLIANPPYVRHQHMTSEDKIRLQAAAWEATGFKFSGLSGLYCYFLALSHSWMAKDGLAAWLIPSEFMDVNYGRAVKDYLIHRVSLIHVHRFDPNDAQFNDALVSSAIVFFRNCAPQINHTVRFSFGGSLSNPAIEKKLSLEVLKKTAKWSRYPKSAPPEAYTGFRLKDLFSIKRGLATGDNNFFILPEARALELQIPSKFLRPILPSTRHIKTNLVESEIDGIPRLEKKLLLLDCNLPPTEVQEKFPALWDYLKTGLTDVAPRYLCQSRKHWYCQENRPPAPIICTYMGRAGKSGENPFRFILNESQATATNVYLMLYPTPILQQKLDEDPSRMRRLWSALNDLSIETLLGNGRVYGGGLYKMEPKELANIPADTLAAIAELSTRDIPTQLELT